MRNDWLIMPQGNLNEKDNGACNKLLDFMKEIEDGRGWRYTNEQANTLAKLVDSLIEQIRAENKKRNQARKISLLFFK